MPAARKFRDMVQSAGRGFFGALLAPPLRALPLGLRLRVAEALRHTRRRIDFAPAPLYLEVASPGEIQRLHPCAKEPETVQWLLDHAGREFVLFDIGANVGAYSLIAAACDPLARVIAFEPGYATYPRLVDNIRVNSLADRVSALQVALGHRTAILDFGYSALDAGAADHPGIGRGAPQTACATHPVLCYRLDDLVTVFDLPLPTLLKLDVDGAELSVLQGATATLRSPELRSILVEVREHEAETADVAELLGSAGFIETGGRIHEGGVVRNSIWDRAEGTRP